MRRDLRLAQILRAGADLIAAQGFAGCTMRSVAASAGLSPASLYRHVQGREELLYLIQEHILERAIRSAEAALARRGALVQLRTFVTDHIRRVAAFPAEARLLEEGASELPDYLRQRIETKRQAYEELACALVEPVCQARAPRRATTRLRALMLLGMADRMAREAARSGKTTPVQRLARAVLDVFLDGVRA